MIHQYVVLACYVHHPLLTHLLPISTSTTTTTACSLLVQVLDYLRDPAPGYYDIHLEIKLQPEDSAAPSVISRTNASNLYWSMKQQLTHHTSTGCNLQPGDLLGSGTISGNNEESLGSMLELSWRGERTVKLDGGKERKFLQDGDTVILSGFAQGNGYRIGFGDCVGKVLPAITE
jgi:fumarylacetoacetase